MSFRVVIKDEDLVKLKDEIIARYFPPVQIEIDCPYAEYVEFGASPASGENKTSKVYDEMCGDYVTEVNLKIRRWANHRLNLGSNAKKVKETGDRIYHSVMVKGTVPHPFIRPAMNYLDSITQGDGAEFNRLYKERVSGSYDPEIKISEFAAELVAEKMRKFMRRYGYDKDPLPSEGRILYDSVKVTGGKYQIRNEGNNKYGPDKWKEPYNEA